MQSLYNHLCSEVKRDYGIHNCYNKDGLSKQWTVFLYTAHVDYLCILPYKTHKKTILYLYVTFTDIYEPAQTSLLVHMYDFSLAS